MTLGKKEKENLCMTRKEKQLKLTEVIDLRPISDHLCSKSPLTYVDDG